MPPPAGNVNAVFASASIASRKRRLDESTLEIFTLTEQSTRHIHPIKRARLIQELPTSPTEPREPRPALSSTSSSSASSSDDDSTSSSGSEADDDIDEDLASDASGAGSSSASESDGSSTSSSSSSSSDSVSRSPSPSPVHATFPAPLPPPGQSSLASRLNAFLPNLAAANRQLEVERSQGVLGQRDVEDLGEDGEDGQYIEMDLGLGVLEERREGDSTSSGSESGDECEEEDEMVDVGEGRSVEKDVMGKLMGRRKPRGEKPSIQEVESVS